MGFTSRFLGLTCDAMVGARVVTSSGELLVVDERNHSDLFWVRTTLLFFLSFSVLQLPFFYSSSIIAQFFFLPNSGFNCFEFF